MNEEPTKTTAEWLEIVRSGGRVTNHHTRHAEEDSSKCPTSHGVWRTLVCDGETDVIECERCGKQRIARCNFDEEYA